MKKIVLFVFVLLFLFTHKVEAATKTLTPSTDTFLSGTVNNTNINYGGNQMLRFKKSQTETYPVLFKFIFSSLPEGQKITSATLQLNQESVNGDPVIVATSIQLYPIASSWVENTVNWDNRPNLGTKLKPPASSGGIFKLEKTLGYQSWDITELTQNWIDKITPNYGIYIDTTVNGWSSIFTSKEGINKPKLVIEYTPVPTIAPFVLPKFKFIPGLTGTSPTPLLVPTTLPYIIPTVIPTGVSPVPTRLPTIAVPEPQTQEQTMNLTSKSNEKSTHGISVSDTMMVTILKVGFIILLVLVILKYTVFNHT
jgi:hypothetical protein